MVISNLKIGTSYFFTPLAEFAKENIRYLLTSKYILLRLAKSVEKIDEDKYRVHTLLSHYDFCKKDVISSRYGQIKIDIYSGKIQLKPDEYIDTTPKGNFLEEMLSR